MSPATGMAVIVVAVNGTLSYAELPPSGPQQLAEARRINPSKILTTYLFSFALSPGHAFPSLYYRFTVYATPPSKIHPLVRSHPFLGEETTH